MYGGRLRGEIIRRIFGRDLHFLVAPDLNESLGGLAIGAVGFQPHALFDGDRNVVEADRRARRKLGALAANTMIIVQLRAANPERNIQVACPAATAVGNGTQSCRYAVGFLVGNFVADEVRGRIGFLFQNPKVTVEFFTKNFKDRRLGKGCRETENN